jgi:hypothetical protein
MSGLERLLQKTKPHLSSREMGSQTARDMAPSLGQNIRYLVARETFGMPTVVS